MHRELKSARSPYKKFLQMFAEEFGSFLGHEVTAVRCNDAREVPRLGPQCIGETLSHPMLFGDRHDRHVQFLIPQRRGEGHVVLERSIKIETRRSISPNGPFSAVGGRQLGYCAFPPGPFASGCKSIRATR